MIKIEFWDETNNKRHQVKFPWDPPDQRPWSHLSLMRQRLCNQKVEFLLLNLNKENFEKKKNPWRSWRNQKISTFGQFCSTSLVRLLSPFKRMRTIFSTLALNKPSLSWLDGLVKTSIHRPKFPKFPFPFPFPFPSINVRCEY